jgi:hypothetical protein
MDAPVHDNTCWRHEGQALLHREGDINGVSNWPQHWSVTPLLHRIHGGFDEERVTADKCQALNDAISIDECGEPDCALNPGQPGEFRILRPDMMNQHTMILPAQQRCEQHTSGGDSAAHRMEGNRSDGKSSLS